MSYAYTYYHHHQFDRPFLSPLPMPSPKSCWYPQRKEVQFGYSYQHPEPDPPWLHQTTEYQQSTSYEPELYSHLQPLTAAYGQPPYASFDSGVNNTGWPPPPIAPVQMPEPYHHCPPPVHRSTTALPARRTLCPSCIFLQSAARLLLPLQLYSLHFKYY